MHLSMMNVRPFVVAASERVNEIRRHLLFAWHRKKRENKRNLVGVISPYSHIKHCLNVRAVRAVLRIQRDEILLVGFNFDYVFRVFFKYL